eukprot:scaffold311_cov173-Amphora_coffeaeformis.AAC.13
MIIDNAPSRLWPRSRILHNKEILKAHKQAQQHRHPGATSQHLLCWLDEKSQAQQRLNQKLID